MCEKNATNGACFKSPGCKPLFDGKHCELCEIGYYKVGNLCQSCNCDINGGLSFRCDFNGKCDCKTGYSGDKCDSCIPGFYDSDGNDADENVHCSECLCNIGGSLKSDNTTCTNTDPCPCSTNGICTCRTGYNGEKCNLCNMGYFDSDFISSNTMANCSECLCNIEGSLKSDNTTCTNTIDPCPCGNDGVCTCSIGYIGDKCELCEIGYYKVGTLCQSCDCDVNGRLREESSAN